MGMTNDYAVALEEGATLVRVGTAIFGERSKKQRVTDDHGFSRISETCLARVWHRRLQANATVCQILAAIVDLARRDLCRLDQRNVRRAYVTIHRSLPALVEIRHEELSTACAAQ